MNIFFGFAPYIAFFLFMQVVSIDAGLWAALTVAVLNAGRDWVRSGSLKVLELGTVFLFGALASFASVEHWEWTVMAVRLAVDAGLLAIVLISLAIGRPFTLQYARERVPEQYWHAPLFLTINRRITWCLRNASRGTCCRRLRACGAMVARYRGYNLRARSGSQVHREVSGARAQKGGDCRGLRAQSRLTPSEASSEQSFDQELSLGFHRRGRQVPFGRC